MLASDGLRPRKLTKHAPNEMMGPKTTSSTLERLETLSDAFVFGNTHNPVLTLIIIGTLIMIASASVVVVALRALSYSTSDRWNVSSVDSSNLQHASGTFDVKFINNLEGGILVDLYLLDQNQFPAKEVFLHSLDPSSTFDYKVKALQLFIIREQASQKYIKTIFITENDRESALNSDSFHGEDIICKYFEMSDEEKKFRSDYEEMNNKKWESVYPPLPNYLGFNVPPESYQAKFISLENPRIAIIDDLISEKEAFKMKGMIERTFVSIDTALSVDPVRHLSLFETPAIEKISQRLFRIFGIKYSRQEAALRGEDIILRMNNSDSPFSYRPKSDIRWPDVETHKSDIAVHSGANIYATVFLFLNDDFEGGLLTFPQIAGGQALNLCSSSFNGAVPPKLGRAVILYHRLNDGNLDITSSWADCALQSGERYLMEFRLWDPFITKDH